MSKRGYYIGGHTTLKSGQWMSPSSRSESYRQRYPNDGLVEGSERRNDHSIKFSAEDQAISRARTPGKPHNPMHLTPEYRASLQEEQIRKPRQRYINPFNMPQHFLKRMEIEPELVVRRPAGSGTMTLRTLTPEEFAVRQARIGKAVIVTVVRRRS